MKSWGRLAAAAAVTACAPAAMLVVGVLACGPDFEPEVFVPQHQPEAPAHFAEGHLGVLQSGYFHAELVVAYRYLNGGRLDDAEKAAYAPPISTPEQQAQLAGRGPIPSAGAEWLKARASYSSAVAAPPIATFAQERVIEAKVNGYVERSFELNCADPAFTTATLALQARAKAWGPASAAFQEWLRGQDAVFSNCEKPGTMPAAAQPGWSAALRQDRAYQISAAKFYAGDFDGAIADFVAIANDKASPWSRWGEYLAGRAEVRKAASTGKTANYGDLANFDKDGLQAAQRRLAALESATKDPEIRHAAAAELGFVEVRLDPGKRLDQVSVALAGPKTDPEFAPDLADLDFLLDRGAEGKSDLVRWIAELRSGGNPDFPAKPAAKTPGPLASPYGLAEWRRQHTLPWLVAAIAEMPGSDAARTELMAAAAEVKPDSPAYVTLNYHRVRLMLDAGERPDARALASTVLAGLGLDAMASTRNAFLEQRMRTAKSLTAFLPDVPRTVIEMNSSAAGIAQCGNGPPPASGCVSKVPPQQFDEDASNDFNLQMPLGVWEEAAQSTLLPRNLREAVASAAWMRAVGLGDEAATRRISALLPAAVRKVAGESDGFPATLALLRNPGMRPYLEQGVQRSASYGQLDDFRDNWWCGEWGSGAQRGNAPLDTSKVLSAWRLEFITAEQTRQAREQVTQLNDLPVGAVWLGQRVIAYVKLHPEDKDAAEALALTVRATHFGCSGDSTENGQKAISKEAFEMLHRLYPKSAWAEKTKYYY